MISQFSLNEEIVIKGIEKKQENFLKIKRSEFVSM